MRPPRATIALLLSIPLLGISIAAADEQVDLEVKRVALFSSGVAYYECRATVNGNAEAELTFRVEQINDILKSLVVQDFGGGAIGAVSYASQDPIEKTLRSFGVDITGKPTLAKLLDQLRGQPVEITGDRSLTGVIVGVEQRQSVVGEKVVNEDVLNVLTENGVQQLLLSKLAGIRLTDQNVADELQKALATLARSADASKKSVVLRFNGQGERRVMAAYLLEAPIWKTSYRLVLDEEKDPFLQGWATVENATEEDWRDVSLSLVAGRPISFQMDLYTPIYIPRPMEELELYASLRPPTYEGAREPSPSAAPMRAGMGGALGESRRRAGEQYVRGKEVERLAALGYVGDAEEDKNADGYAWDLADSGVASVASATDAGELFEYHIDAPVTIPRQHSAMLPIVHQEIKGTKVSIYNPATHAKYPLNGLELTNTSELHLMQGPITLFDAGVYAGDAKLPDVKPGEKRLIAYALDLSTEVDVKRKPTPDKVVSMRIIKGTLIQTRKYVDDREYVIKNKSDRSRTVLLEQPYGDEWKLIEPQEPYERTASLSRFKVEVPAGKTAAQRVNLEQVADQSIALSNVRTDQIAIYMRSRVISEKLKDALQKVIAMRNEVEAVARQRARAEQESQEAVKEQARIRDNLRTLQQNTDAHRRQMQKFDDVETQIEEYAARTAKLRDEEEVKRAALDEYLMSLNVE